MEVLRRVHRRQEYIVGTYNNQLQAPVHPPGVVSSEPTSYLKFTHNGLMTKFEGIITVTVTLRPNSIQ